MQVLHFEKDFFLMIPTLIFSFLMVSEFKCPEYLFLT